MISEDSGSSLRTVRPLGAETADICLRCSSQFIRHARFHFPLSAFLFATLMNLFFFSPPQILRFSSNGVRADR